MLRELWEEFEAEIPAPPEFVETWDEEWQDVSADIGGRGVVYLAEDDDGVIGAVRGTMLPGDVWHIVFAHVRPRARRQGLLKRLMAPVIEEGRSRGSTRVTLDVMADNHAAVAAWKRLGFEPAKLVHGRAAGHGRRAHRGRRAPALAGRDLRADRRSRRGRAGGREVPAADRPLGDDGRSPSPSNGWTRVDDELCSRDPGALRRLGRELSLALGAIVLTLGVEEGAVVRYILWDRGGVADEYLSVPEYFAELPPGDVVALAANPTVAHRLTGADPAQVRAVARTAESPDELPPPDELHELIATVLGVG